MTKNIKLNSLVMTALMMCMITVTTMFIKVPIPFTQGYVHLGDAMIYLSVLLLGKKNGALAAGVGSAMGDLLGGAGVWAPWTLVVKLLMALITGFLVEEMFSGNKPHGKTLGLVLPMTMGGLEMVASYYVAEGVIYGNWAAPVIGVPWNVGQFATGIIIAIVLASALCKSPAKEYFNTKIV